MLAEAGKHGNYSEMALFDKVSTYVDTTARWNIDGWIDGLLYFSISVDS